MKKKTNTFQLLAIYIPLILTWLIVLSSAVDSNITWLRILIVIILVGGLLSTVFLLVNMHQNINSEREKSNYLTFSYRKDVHSRESMFANDFDHFVKNHNISSPDYFAQACIQAGMTAYENALSNIPYDSVLNEETMKVSIVVDNPKRPDHPHNYYIRY